MVTARGKLKGVPHVEISPRANECLCKTCLDSGDKIGKGPLNELMVEQWWLRLACCCSGKASANHFRAPTDPRISKWATINMHVGKSVSAFLIA